MGSSPALSEEGGPGSPPRVLSCLLFATGIQLDGKVSELLSPNLHFPPNLHGNAAFNITLGNLFFEVPAKYWGTPVVYVAFLTAPGGP